MTRISATLAVFRCTKTTNFPGDYCEVTIKQNSLWRCLSSLGLTPCTPPNDNYPYFAELVGKITKDQFDPETGSLVANLYEKNGFIGENCSVSTSKTTSAFQLKLNAGGSKGYAKSFTIEVSPPGSNCGAQNFYKIGGGYK